ncbi:MAG: DUF342 domain-containing protein [Deltaproteobacteria bacterium]|nr:DUF342 domain-containing protein [Deltaproteobacteria bacterium]
MAHQLNLAGDDRTLAQLALSHRILTSEQMAEAVAFRELQEEQGRLMTLEDVLLSRKMISELNLSRLRLLLEFRKRREPDRIFSKILMKNRLATPEQLETATRMQLKQFKEHRTLPSLADILVNMGVISPRRVEKVRKAVEAILKARESHEDEQQRESPDTCQCPSPSVCTDNSSLDGASDCESVFHGKYFDILVNGDATEAYLRVKGEARETIEPQEVLETLAQTGITQGLVDASEIREYLHGPSCGETRKIVAHGNLPKPGVPGSIRFPFQDSAGTPEIIGEERCVGLKDRGRVPQVKCGDVVAEVIPPLNGTNGVDVYGRVIPPPPCPVQRLFCGKGVERTPDGLRFHATIDGKPHLSPCGMLSVLPELVIEEDVSFETGNIMFDGRVEVRGVIQDGFRVECDELVAREISKATVEVNGSVTVYGGILGARIKSKGAVSAAHVHASRIEALGDVTVEKGIVESVIMTAGKCLIPRGKVIYSKVLAREGIEVGQVGSDRSVPCSLAFGFDPVTQRELETLKESISLKKNELHGVHETIAKLTDQMLKTEAKIGTLAQVQDRSSLQLSSIAKDLDSLKEAGDAQGVAEKQAQLLQLQDKIRNAELELDRLFQEQEESKGKIQEHQRHAVELRKAIESFQENWDILNDWAEAKKGPVAVTIYHSIASGTTVKGPGSSLVLEVPCSRVQIREDSPDGCHETVATVPMTKMKIYTLK